MTSPGIALSSRVRPGSTDSGRAVVFIHGVGSSSAAWAPVIAAMPDSYTVITYDLRGHGASPRPPGPYVITDFVDDHVALVGSLGHECVHVVGESLGGLIAQAIAVRAPQSVDGVVILSAIAGRTEAERTAALIRFQQLVDRGPDPVWLRTSASRWFTPQFMDKHPDVVEEMLARIATNDWGSYVAAYRVLATTDLGDELDRIKSPTLVMTGADDVGSPPHMSRLLHERIHDSQLVILQGQRHLPSVETPDVVAAHIDRFLSGLPHAAAS